MALNPPLGERDHVIGFAGALVELVEYGDFECPHCTRAAVIVKQIQAELGGKLLFAFRHFPLSKMHPHARMAAMASEAASAQGRFWPMHDELFKHSQALEPVDLVAYAEAMGLDLSRFETELANDIYSGRVQEDVSSGVRSGVNGTPTFFINGKRHNGGYDFESLMGAIGI